MLAHGVNRSPYLTQLIAPYGVYDAEALQAKMADMRTTEQIIELSDRVRKVS
jgi:hypothetical protein